MNEAVVQTQIHRKVLSEAVVDRKEALNLLAANFPHLPDRSQAWQDLHNLTRDKDGSVRWGAAEALGEAFGLVPDRSQAWQDLHNLTQDKDDSVRWGAARALGEAFGLVPDRSQAWQDLHNLTQDKDDSVRIFALHSLGKISILKATETDNREKLIKELENAIEYFERTSMQSPIINPAQFCLPFYRYYLAITFRGAPESEVQNFLVQAKQAVQGSESKEMLLEAVENLAKALQESQKLKGRPLEEIIGELYSYRWYCDKATENLPALKERAPGAAKLICKGLPIIDARIQATIADIQDKANKICQLTRGKNSAYEALGRELRDAAGSLGSHELVQMLKSSNRIVSQLKGLCKILPEGKRELTCDAIKEIELATSPPERLAKIELALAYALPAVEENMDARYGFGQFKTELAEEIRQFRDQLLEHMDRNQKEEIEIILKALQESRPQEEQFADLLECMMQLISQLNEQKISDKTLRENWEMIAEALNNLKKDDKEKLELIIPFIPGFLQYKAVIDLPEGIRLKNLYEKIARISKSGKIFALKYQ